MTREVVFVSIRLGGNWSCRFVRCFVSPRNEVAGQPAVWNERGNAAVSALQGGANVSRGANGIHCVKIGVLIWWQQSQRIIQRRLNEFWILSTWGHRSALNFLKSELISEMISTSLSEVRKHLLFCCSRVAWKSTTAMMVLPTDVWTSWEERGKTELWVNCSKPANVCKPPANVQKQHSNSPSSPADSCNVDSPWWLWVEICQRPSFSMVQEKEKKQEKEEGVC